VKGNIAHVLNNWLAVSIKSAKGAVPLHYFHPQVPRPWIELIQRIKRAQNKIVRRKIVF
jgi:hypothetical protein